MKKEKGITLVALVVTIIVLLILAGVTIGLVLGQDGIINKAQTAAQKTNESQELEILNLAVSEAMQADVIEDKSFEEVFEAAMEGVKNNYPGTTVAKLGSDFIATMPSGNRYLVDNQGNITKYESDEELVTVTDVWYKIEGTVLHLSNSDLGGYTKQEGETSMEQPPAWLDLSQESSLTQVILENKIAPTSTAFWFAACPNLTEIGSKVNDSYVANSMENLDTRYVTNMMYMFAMDEKLSNIDVSHFDTSNVTNMSYMFAYCPVMELDVSHFNTSKVTNMFAMFAMCSNITSLDVTNFDTSNVTSSNVYDGMAAMFEGCSKLERIDGISEFDTAKATDMSSMFHGCSSLQSLDLSKWDTSSVIYMTNMFLDCSALQTLKVSNFNISKVTSLGDMFSGCRSLTELDLTSFDTSNIETNNYYGNMLKDVSCPIKVKTGKWTLTKEQTSYAGADFTYVN